MSSHTAAAVAAGSCFASFLNTSILDREASASSKEACSLAPNLSCMLDILTYPRSLEAHHFLRAFAQPGAEPDPGVVCRFAGIRVTKATRAAASRSGWVA